MAIRGLVNTCALSRSRLCEDLTVRVICTSGRAGLLLEMGKFGWQKHQTELTPKPGGGLAFRLEFHISVSKVYHEIVIQRDVQG